MGGTLTSATDCTRNQGDRVAHRAEVFFGGGDFKSAEGRTGLARSTNILREDWVYFPCWNGPQVGVAGFGVFLLLFGVFQGGEGLCLSW